MKKSIIMVAAMIIAVSASANSFSKKSKAPKTTTYTAAETTYDADGSVKLASLEAYNVAEIAVPARVRFIEGKSYGINVISIDGNSESNVRYKVKNGKLRVFTTAENVENGSYVINLIVPVLPEVKTSFDLDKINIR